MALRSFVSLAPAVVLLISFLAVYHYPITREKHAQIRAELARRKSSGQP
jgi:Na+/melibiose symporter-like transporter